MRNWALVLVTFLPTVAWSQPAAKPATKVAYNKKTTIDFEEKAVDGEFLRPDGSAVQADKNTDFESLLGARANFGKELKRSSGAIR